MARASIRPSISGILRSYYQIERLPVGSGLRKAPALPIRQ